MPAQQPKRGRLWLGDGSCIRLRPERRDHVWAYDFVEERTHDGRKFRTLNVVDEYTHECLAIRVARKLKSTDVIDVLSDLFILRGVPNHIRSDNGPEFVAKAVQKWIAAVGARTAYIAHGSPWENGYVESFNARFRDELLNGEVFYSLREAEIIIESWRRHYNAIRPHASLGYRPPAPEVGGANLHRLAGCADPTCFAGQATRGAAASGALTFTPDHPVGPITQEASNAVPGAAGQCSGGWAIGKPSHPPRMRGGPGIGAPTGLARRPCRCDAVSTSSPPGRTTGGRSWSAAFHSRLSRVGP